MFKVLLTLLVGMFLSVDAFAQQITVKGLVKDGTGEPVIGANVLVKGTTNGTITDFDGNFQLTANQGDIIVVSFIGYTTQELPAAANMNIILKDDTELMEEVVVIGYGAVKKNDLTGSVTAIKAEEINRGAISSPDQMLQGKVPGLLVTPASGDPTESATIRIRGAASLTANNDPLIVIDGIPVAGNGAGMANPLSTVNPNDIESYTVLKDASATAIYGSRASNGVIMITTKKGRGDKIQVSYNSSYSVKQNTSTLDMMNANQYRETIERVYANSSLLDTYRSMLGNANTNWQDEIYRLGFSTDQNISVYGNKGGLPFRASVGYNYNEGTLKDGSNQRANASISLTPTFLQDHLSVNVNLKGIYNKADYMDGGAVGAAVSFNPTQPVYFTNPDGGIDYSKCNGYWNWLYSDGSANTQSPTNPLSQFEYFNVNDTWRSMGNVQLDYKIHGFEELRFNLNLGYDFARTTGEKHNTLGSFAAQRANPDLHNEYFNQNSNTLLEFYGNYNKEFGIHHLDVMGGYSWQHYYEKNGGIDFYNENRDEVYNESPTYRKEYYLVSFFGRLNYSLDSKYLFTFSLRDDASSRFSKDNRWGLFPSAAFAWNIAEENFIKNNHFFSSMKLRLGWGQTGQQDIGNNFYPYQAKYSLNEGATTTLIPWGDKFIHTLAPGAYNPNIKWETTETWNVGLDFGIFGGRIHGNIDAYYRKTFDLLNDITTPMGNNFSNSVIANIGNMENKGIEFNLNFIPIERDDMRWTINVNGTWQDTEITKLTNSDETYLGVQVGPNMGGTEGYTSLHRVGYAPYTYYLFQQAYDENGKAIQNVIVDRDGDGTITENDRYVTGKSITPKFFYGISSQFTYKKWDFGFNAHGSIGGYALNRIAMNNSTAYLDPSLGFINNLSPYALETGWTKNHINAQKYSDMFLENTTFFRMDDINVGYTFDKIGNWKGSVRVGASVQNVFTISDYSGLDPEITARDGVDNNLVPRPRLYTIRLNVNF